MQREVDKPQLNLPMVIPYGAVFDMPHQNQVDIQFSSNDLL